MYQPMVKGECMNTENSVASGFDTREYRNALGRFATGVCLISTRDAQGRARAMTANSFTSVSLSPPIILWCIDIRSERFALFNEAETFAVSVLRAGQDELSRHHAKLVEAELLGDDLIVGESGIPRFAGALAWVECRTSWRQKAGDHVIIFGQVMGYGAESGDALGFFRGGYHTVPDRKD